MKESTLFQQFKATDKNFSLVNLRLKELAEAVNDLAQTRVQDYLRMEAMLRILRKSRLRRWVLCLTMKSIKKETQQIVEEIKQKQIEAAEKERVEKEEAEKMAMGKEEEEEAKEEKKTRKSAYNPPPKEEHRPEKPTLPPPPKEAPGYSGA